MVFSDEFCRLAEEKLLRRIHFVLGVFVVLLVLSGVTAFPVQTEINFLAAHSEWLPAFTQEWLQRVTIAVNETGAKHQFLFYGCDWLAFAHIVIALFFIGVYRQPVQNAWVLRVGMIACIGIFPLAFIAGEVRGIPVFWRLIDCSFGLFGLLPLLLLERMIKKLQRIQSKRNDAAVS